MLLMDEAFLKLSVEDRRDVLGIAADRSRRPAHLLEKDVWVVWVLSILYESSLGQNLVFKGGTSLSKAYKAIQRFSEDVDLTLDIRMLAADLVGKNGDPIPKTRSEEKRWSKAIRQRLPVWVAEQAEPLLQNALASDTLPATTRVEGDKLFLDYEPTALGTGYVAPTVVLEFGGRSTGEPASVCDVLCDAVGLVDGVAFPSARPRVMHAERTFWEKATAIHVYCRQERLRGERFSRHWHDIVSLDRAGIVDVSLKDRALAEVVATHKGMFFLEKDLSGSPIDYMAAVRGALSLVPSGEAFRELEKDYVQMVQDGMLEGDADSFEDLLSHIAEIEQRANRLE